MKRIKLFRLGVLAALIVSAGIVGCASHRNVVVLNLEPRKLSEIERPLSTSAPSTARPTIALVLGGGGLRGFAHIGVLRALEEAGIKPDIVVGASAGAVVGAAYSSGLSAAQIEAAGRAVNFWALIDWTLASDGIMRGNSLAAWVNSITANTPIEQFPVRFAAIATDLQSGQSVLLDRGPAGSAIQASAAVPGINIPVPYPSGHLIDGGITSLVPVRFARAMGADIVIAVDIFCQGPRGDGRNVLMITRRVMHTQSCLIAASETAEADILITPIVGGYRMSAKEEQDRAILAGYEAARTVLSKSGSLRYGG